MGILCGLISRRTRSTSTSAPPPGSESRPAACRRRSVSATVRPLWRGDVGHLGRRERVDVDGVARLDVGEDPLEPADVEVGRQAALHHDRRAAQSERLLDLAEDLVAAEQVAFAAARLLVEGAEAAARDAVVGVVDVAVDDEGDVVCGVQAAADFVGRRPQRASQQVAALGSSSSSAAASREATRRPSRVTAVRRRRRTRSCERVLEEDARQQGAQVRPPAPPLGHDRGHALPVVRLSMPR